MKISHTTIVKGIAWTVGAFALTQSVRVVSSIIMTRLLTPELFGIMVIVYSVRTGIDLLSDVGFGQSVVTNKNADQPEFYNTAWSIRLVRGILLWLGCCAAAVPLAHLYQIPILAWILPIAALYFALGGLTSLGGVFLQKRLQLAKLNIFDLIVESISTVSQIIFAYFSPTIWALVFGGLISAVARIIGTHFLVPDVRHKFYISKEYAVQIFSFGKWILVSSTIFFFSANFDYLYLGKVIPLELLGVYGVARNLSEALNALATRVNFTVIFPFIAKHSEMPRADLREQLASTRAKFLLIAAFGFSLLVALADLLIGILYDYRYQDAGWMLPILVIGAWFSMMCVINESTLLGFGKPFYGASSNALKFTVLLIGLPVVFINYGIIGAIIVVLASNILRYFPLLIGQFRERFSFGMQDLAMTLLMFALVGFWEWLRWIFGLGTSFDNLSFPG